MKIKVTIETHEIKALIREDLARQGIVATDDDIAFSKNMAVVTVEASRDPAIVAAPPLPVAASSSTTAQPVPPVPQMPALEVVEGGQQPVDMSNILAASNQIAAVKPGKFPTPERELMEGASHDFPGAPKR